jgi:alanyl-tRNA synthetase
MGLERLSAVVQGVKSNLETDLFQPIIKQIAGMSGVAYHKDEQADISYQVIADHLRAMTFLISDGVLPSNEGRGYGSDVGARSATASSSTSTSRSA